MDALIVRAHVVKLIHRSLAGDFVGVFTANEQVVKIDRLADDILAYLNPPAMLKASQPTNPKEES